MCKGDKHIFSYLVVVCGGLTFVSDCYLFDSSIRFPDDNVNQSGAVGIIFTETCTILCIIVNPQILTLPRAHLLSNLSNFAYHLMSMAIEQFSKAGSFM